MPTPTKEVMVNTLRNAEIEVPNSAIIRQIKVLYNQLPPPLRVPENSEEELEVIQDSANDIRSNTSAPVNAAAFIPPAAITSAYGNIIACASTATTNTEPFAPNHTATPESENIDAQLIRLRKQKECLQLQNEILQLSQQRETTNGRLADVSVIESMVPKFTADDFYDVYKWFNDLEDAFTLLQFDERLRFVACRRMIDGTAKVFARTISVCQYNELKAALLQEFGKKRTTQEVYEQLNTRKMKANESVHRYILEMQEIAMQSNIPETEVVDLIIDGIGDTSSNASMLYSAATIAELKCTIERYERKRLRPSATKKFAPIINKNSAALSQPVVTTAAKPSSANTTNQHEIIRCYNCSKFGHYQSQCPQPKRPVNSCFKCAATDHVYQNCPKRTSPAATVSAVVQMEEDLQIESINSLQMVSVACDSECKHGDFKKLICLFDSGSPKSFIRCSEVPYAFIKWKSGLHFRGIGNNLLKPLGTIEARIKINNKIITHELIVLPFEDMPYAILLGTDFFKTSNIRLYIKMYSYSKERLLELNKNELSIPNCSEITNVLHSLHLFKHCPSHGGDVGEKPIQIFGSLCNRKSTSDRLYSKNSETNCTNNEFINLCNIEPNSTSEADAIDINPMLSPKVMSEVRKIISETYTHFPIDKSKPLDYMMKINLIHDTPIFCRARRLSHYERCEIRKIVDSLLKEGIIKPSNSPYASAIVPVEKKNGDIRLCVDYRPLNRITVRDNYPLPLMEDCIEHLGGKQFFTIIDLKSGFHHVKMHPDSIKYTAFVTPDGQYEYLFMPFGLRNGPPEFQRFINLILNKFITEGSLVTYMDDILIASKNLRTHLSIIRDVLTTLRQNGLKLQLKKCKFVYHEIEYLGYLANSSGISPKRAHLKAIEEYPQPTNRKELERCLGLFSYFRRFVPNFSTIAAPLSKLLRKDSQYTYSEDCKQAFHTLRDKLLEAPILSIYNPYAETELHCDASALGFGAALMQKQNDGKFHPIAYFSKTTSVSEAKLHSYELETLAVVYALKRFNTYLVRIPFKLVTDNNSLALTLHNQSYSAKIARWALMLEKYNYTIVHRPGTAMSHVDALSRSGVIGYIDHADLDFHLQITQNRDPYIVNLRQKLEKEEVKDFKLNDGLVFHISPAGHLQLCVPSEMINNVIRITHEKMGHLASDKCCNKIKRNYWFPYMKSRVNNFISNCIKCIYYSASPYENRANLHCIPKKPEPFDTIHIDHLGPLPSINSKKKYLLAVIDAFTKFVKLYPTTTTNTSEVCSALKHHYFPSYSRPRRIISDRGTCFTSSEFKEFLSSNNIQHIKNATASPKANGQIERINRVLRPMLAKLSEPLNHSDWTEQIYKIEHALNNSVQSSTKNTPSTLLFGIEQRGTIVDELTEYLEELNNVSVRELPTIREQAFQNICQAQEANLKQFSSRHKQPPEFSVGDYVVIKNIDSSVGQNKKLIQRFRGPYIIHKCLPNDRYVIRDIEGCQITQLPYDGILESSKLKLWLNPLHDSVTGATQVTLKSY